MNKTYTTKENIEQYLGEEITDNIDLYILSAQEYIDKYCGRNFKESDEKETRYYNGSGNNELIIDAATEIDSVFISYDLGNSFTEVDSYITEPLNEAPIVKITLRNNRFPNTKMSVKVIGKFGWSECVPKDITYCATFLASMMLKGHSAEEVASERIGDYWVNYRDVENKNGSIKSILDKYKKLF